ncbi:hydroxymethylbilane synthase [Nonomuraea sp. NPDC050663]|uniref:hydroxymethylbilane synthase n=1 Tax=Nonomuraea sp. NPDC050663 TaxID=3364370 RepID=UPI003795BE60
MLDTSPTFVAHQAITPHQRSPLRLGTRRSLMATTQSQMVADHYTALTQRPITLVGIVTEGDTSTQALSQIGGTGVFVSALRDKLIAGEVDIAVHSLKDLPTVPDPRFTIAAVPARDDHRDALVGPTRFADLPAGAKVGTGSPRRIAMLRALRPDLDYVPIRGNADTRIGKVRSGELDAVVLAAAGLARIGRTDDIAEIFEVEQLLPAPGQGALAVECLTSRMGLIPMLQLLDDPATHAAVSAERAVLATLQLGCSSPVGAYATCQSGQVHLTAALAEDADATTGFSAEPRISRMSTRGPADMAASLGASLASRLTGAHA